VSRVETLIDTGPLVAYLVKDDAHHAWACETLRTRAAPVHTCEAVLTEAFHLLSRASGGVAGLSALLDGGFVKIGFRAEEELDPVLRLMARYRELPMSFADGCLVRMSELHDRATLVTIDRDFHVYRKNGRRVIRALLP
jgi:predicted nucleic acid-binding protein